MRMFTPVAALWGRLFLVTGEGSLSARPMGLLEGPLREAGVLIRTRDGFPPLSVRGPLRGGKSAVDGSQSSQLLTGLLTALPALRGGLRGPASTTSRAAVRGDDDFAPGPVRRHRRIRSGLRVFRVAGGQRYRGTTYEVEGDWSAAAFHLVAGALAGPDHGRKLATAPARPTGRSSKRWNLRAAGVAVSDGSITVERCALKGFDFDATDCPDLFPPLVALACLCATQPDLGGGAPEAQGKRPGRRPGRGVRGARRRSR